MNKIGFPHNPPQLPKEFSLRQGERETVSPCGFSVPPLRLPGADSFPVGRRYRLENSASASVCSPGIAEATDSLLPPSRPLPYSYLSIPASVVGHLFSLSLSLSYRSKNIQFFNYLPLNKELSLLPLPPPLFFSFYFRLLPPTILLFSIHRLNVI